MFETTWNRSARLHCKLESQQRIASRLKAPVQDLALFCSATASPDIEELRAQELYWCRSNIAQGLLQ
jgi:hypothetical protein